MAATKNEDPQSVVAQIPEIVGKTVVAARQDAGQFHSLDEGYAQDGPVVIEFADGSSMAIAGYWCNDGTASTEYELSTS